MRSPIDFITVEEYLELELTAQVRHEYVAGQIYAMVGASEAHNIIAGNIFAILRPHLRGSSCKAFISDMNTRGFLKPAEFLDLCSNLPLPKFLGEVEWNEEYAEAVRKGSVEGISFEGVVAKSTTKQRMAKAKTQAWIDRVIKEFGQEEGTKIVNS